MRIRRKILGLSQEQVAEALGMTFQQLQKYEKGSNRVSASKLYRLAQILQAQVSYFYEGLPDPLQAAEEDASKVTAANVLNRFLATPEGMELAVVFPKVGARNVRRRILDLVVALADTPDPSDLTT